MEKQPDSPEVFLSLRLRRTLAAAAAIMMGVWILSHSLTAAAREERSLIGGPDSGITNLLLIGQDSRQEDSRARSDCIILCSLQPSAGKVTIVSFLRDLYVRIPGHDSDRINAAYAYGGMELLKQTMLENFSLHIDGCIEADFAHFPGIIDTLGGVTLELRQDEADAINKAVPGDLTEGTATLTGEQALAYSRIRNLDPDGDFSRTHRQRTLLMTLLDSYRDAGLLTILSLAADIIPMISTDLDQRQLLLLAATLFPLLKEPDISSHRIPAEGSFAYSNVRGMEVLTIDDAAVQAQLRELLTGPAPDAA